MTHMLLLLAHDNAFHASSNIKRLENYPIHIIRSVDQILASGLTHIPLNPAHIAGLLCTLSTEQTSVFLEYIKKQPKALSWFEAENFLTMLKSLSPDSVKEILPYLTMRKNTIADFASLKQMLIDDIFKDHLNFVKDNVCDFMRNLTQELNPMMLDVLHTLELISRKKNYEGEEISELALAETLELTQSLLKDRCKTIENVNELLLNLLNIPSNLRLEFGHELLTLTQNRFGDADSILNLVDLEKATQAQHLSEALHKLTDQRAGDTNEICEILDELSHAKAQKTASGGRRASLTKTAKDFLTDLEQTKARLPLSSVVELMQKITDSLNEKKPVDVKSLESALTTSHKITLNDRDD